MQSSQTRVGVDPAAPFVTKCGCISHTLGMCENLSGGLISKKENSRVKDGSVLVSCYPPKKKSQFKSQVQGFNSSLAPNADRSQEGAGLSF